MAGFVGTYTFGIKSDETGTGAAVPNFDAARLCLPFLHRQAAAASFIRHEAFTTTISNRRLPQFPCCF
jgi:hypothetical protein